MEDTCTILEEDDMYSWEDGFFSRLDGSLGPCGGSPFTDYIRNSSIQPLPFTIKSPKEGVLVRFSTKEVSKHLLTIQSASYFKKMSMDRFFW